MSRMSRPTEVFTRVNHQLQPQLKRCYRCSTLPTRPTLQHSSTSKSSVLHSPFGISSTRWAITVRHYNTASGTSSSTSSKASSERSIDTQKAYERLRPILDDLPPNIDWAVAYGSGVIHQANALGGPPPMTDFLLSTSDPISFHEKNLRLNPSHYPLWARLSGAKRVARVQENMGAETWYVTMVNMRGMEVKYGIISTASLMRDLKSWSTLYVAGRLHKPVLTLKSTPSIISAQQSNLSSALSVALLQLPPRFTEYALWEQIAGISYSGDPRMSVPGAENPEKVKNIVRGPGNLQGFRELYIAALKSLGGRAGEMGVGLKWEGEGGGRVVDAWKGDGEGWIVSVSDEALLENLPVRVKNAIKPVIHQVKGEEQSTMSGSSLAEEKQFQTNLAKVLKDIIHRPALIQSMKGLLTAGFTKSLYYSLAKFRKWLKSRQAKGKKQD